MNNETATQHTFSITVEIPAPWVGYITQNSDITAIAIGRANRRENSRATTMNVSTPTIVRSDHSRNAVPSTEVLWANHCSAFRIGGGSSNGLNSIALTAAP